MALTEEYISFLYNPYFGCLSEWGASKTGHTTEIVYHNHTTSHNSTKILSLHTTIHSLHTKIHIVLTQRHMTYNQGDTSLLVPPPSPDLPMFRTPSTNSCPADEEGRLKTQLDE
jgi:hypothetical protein